MATTEELQSKAVASYLVYLGCLCLARKKEAESAQITGKELQEKLHKLFIPQDLVTTIHKESASPKLSKLVVGEGISTEPALKRGLEILTLDEPIKMNLSYSSEVLGPDYYERFKKKYPMNITLFYDGSLYILSIQRLQDDFSYRGQAVGLHNWLSNLLSKLDGFSVLDVSPSPFSGVVFLYLLREPTKELAEQGWWFGVHHESSAPRFLTFSYVCENHPAHDAIRDAMESLYDEMKERCRQFYSCQMLFSQIQSENRKARERIGRVASETLSFYDISFLNLWKRFQKSREIGKDLAHLYVVMPQIEKLNNEYQNTQTRLETVGTDEAQKGFAALFMRALTRGIDNIFTQSIREMLQQDVSEIRAQINYQMLLFSAIVTFLAIIITAILTLL